MTATTIYGGWFFHCFRDKTNWISFEIIKQKYIAESKQQLRTCQLSFIKESIIQQKEHDAMGTEFVR